MHSAEVGSSAAGGKMVESLEISNFRCFSRVKLSGLGWINVVVGRNGSGKTALLEALFLAAARDPGVALRLRALRGLGLTTGGSTPIIAASLWTDLFHEFNTEQKILIEIKGGQKHNRSLIVSYSPEEAQTTFNLNAPSAINPTQIQLPLAFEWRQGSEAPFIARPSIVGDNINLPQHASQQFEAHFFGSNVPLPAQQNAELFTVLSRQNKEEKIIASIKSLFPFIQDITVATGAGLAWLDAKVAGHSVKLPLGLVSAGITKLISILLAMASAEGGIIIVDEIENGFYYETLPLIWKIIRAACDDYKVQVFASTHSLECLEAVANVAQGDADGFALIQTKQSNGTSEARRISGRHFVDAVEEDIEVR